MTPSDVVYAICEKAKLKAGMSRRIDWQEKEAGYYTAHVRGIDMHLFKNQSRGSGVYGVLIISDGRRKVTIVEPEPHPSRRPSRKLKEYFGHTVAEPETPEEIEREKLREAFDQLFSLIREGHDIHRLPEISFQEAEYIFHVLGISQHQKNSYEKS